MSRPPYELPPPTELSDFHVAIICAKEVEFNPIFHLLEKRWHLANFSFHKSDVANFYHLGRIGGHDVVVLCLWEMGLVSTAHASSGMLNSFRHIKLCIISGMCAGAPYKSGQVNGSPEKEDIFLGDVIISDKVVDWANKIREGRKMESATVVNSKADMTMKNLFEVLRRKRERSEFERHVQEALSRLVKKDSRRYAHPGVSDVLCAAGCLHRHPRENCAECLKAKRCIKAESQSCSQLSCQPIERIRNRGRDVRQDEIRTPPRVHIGCVASSSVVLRSAAVRDDVLRTHRDVVGFDMETTAAWSRLPTVMVKGVCDYADSHKNKIWQPYASAAAAACVETILKVYWRPRQSFQTATTQSFTDLATLGGAQELRR